MVHSNATGLRAGESYTETIDVILPKGLDGNFWVFLIGMHYLRVPRPQGEIEQGGDHDLAYGHYLQTAFEANNNNNNISRADLPITYREPDLQVSSLVVPQNPSSSGDLISVGWTVSYSERAIPARNTGSIVFFCHGIRRSIPRICSSASLYTKASSQWGKPTHTVINSFAAREYRG